MITREQDREMILNPLKWPLLNLPIKRRATSGGFPELAFVYAPVSINELDPRDPITVYLGTIFEDPSTLPTKTYKDVDALLDDGWVGD